MGTPGTGWQARWMRGQGASRCLRQEGLAGREGLCRDACLCACCVRGVCVSVYICAHGACARANRSGAGWHFCVHVGWHVSVVVCTCGGCPIAHTHTHTYEPTEPQAGPPGRVQAERGYQAPPSYLPSRTRPTVDPGTGWSGHTSLGGSWGTLGPSLTSTENSPPQFCLAANPRAAAAFPTRLVMVCARAGPPSSCGTAPAPALQAGVWELGTVAADMPELKGGVRLWEQKPLPLLAPLCPL